VLSQLLFLGTLLCASENTTAMTLPSAAENKLYGGIRRLSKALRLPLPKAPTLVIKPLAFVPISVGILEDTVTSSSIIGPLASKAILKHQCHAGIFFCAIQGLSERFITTLGRFAECKYSCM